MISSKNRQPASSLAWWRCPPGELIAFLKAGIPAAIVQEAALKMGMPTKQLAEILGFSATTLARKIRDHQTLDLRQGEIAIGLVRLVGQIEALQEPGDEQIDAAAWLANWILSPVSALGNALPADFLDTSTGQQMISQMLAAVVHGSYV